MDARGNENIEGVGYVAFINLNDRHSRARLLSYPCALSRAQSHPTTKDYKTLLGLTFSEWGLPERPQVDHESAGGRKGHRSGHKPRTLRTGKGSALARYTTDGIE